MNDNEDQPEQFDFETHRLKAIAAYQKIRPLYEEFAEVLRNVLSEAFSTSGVQVHSVEARAKEIDSFGKKASTPSEQDPNTPQYPDALADITDLVGARVITFLPRTIDEVESIIGSEFEVLDKSDKTQILIREERLGYASIHYIVQLKENRTALLEYSRFASLVAEIQVRTILQHAWAEIEHDIQYKSVDTIPTSIRRRFMSLAGMLEVADREFQAVQDDDHRIRQEARKSVQEGKFEEVEITPDALKTYLDRKLGPDGRMTVFSYQFTASVLRTLGFTDFKEIDECISEYDDDKLSRILWGSRQGQISRFEYQLVAGMGENYTRLHRWATQPWFVKRGKRYLAKFREAGVEVGSYLPPAKEASEPMA